METTLPALSVAFISSASIDPIYRPLANPAGLGFFLFIILSKLRLSSTLCWISGLTAAISYLAAAAHLGWRPSLNGGASLLSPEKAVLGYAIAFIMGGFVAGVIAGEIRKQAEGALREADTRRQLECVEHDLSLARSIQQSLLPDLEPQMEGFEELLSAGHAPLFIYSLSQDRFEEIGAQGPPLGIAPQFVANPPMILELDAGELLVLATDGFFEWTNRDGEQFGVKRIEETIRESRKQRPTELIATLYEAFHAFFRRHKTTG